MGFASGSSSPSEGRRSAGGGEDGEAWRWGAAGDRPRPRRAGGAGAAEAATRYVAPDGTGTACTLEAPCGIETGVEQAADGDEVVVGAGVHTAATEIGESIAFPSPGSITVRGAVIGPGRPVIITREILVRGAGALLQDVDVRSQATSARVTVCAGGRADRVVVRASDGSACGATRGA